MSEKNKDFSAIDTTATTRSSDDMRDLFNKLSSLAREAGSTASDQMLLSSLYFNSIRERHANVAFSHAETFKWVLDPSSATEFEEWLRSRDGIYWIMGKAGSGKSTLMKFLLDHPQTIEALKSWAGTKKLATASFFFWNAGTTIQKFQEGLFRSLLYEILRLRPDLIRIVCASKLATFRPSEGELEPWTQQELWQAIGQLKEQGGGGARFCFFIDGLDEYDGDPDHIVDVLESLRSWPDIKLCVSSRPWNEFIDAFGRPSDPQLALEDLTREDIKTYVWHTLEKNSRFVALKTTDSRSQELVQEIVEKARGVFLWVVLVVRSLLNGLRNADRIYDLQKRLREFPETLEKYFGHILGSIESIYREQTAQAFAFAIAAAEPLSLMTYSFLDEENLDAMATADVNPLATKDISRKDDMRRRLNGRSKGLLEVVSGGNLHEDNYANQICTPKVDFLHRTVRESLLTKDMQNMHSENLKPGFKPRTLFCKALLAQLKALDYHALAFKCNISLPKEILEDLAFYARGYELEFGVLQVTLLDNVSIFVSRQAVSFGLEKGDCGFLEFRVHRELYLYIKESLKRKPRLARLDRSALLKSALELHSTKYSGRIYDLKMIELLLEHGASPNMVWGGFVQSIHKQASLAGDDTLQRVVEVLLRYGANLEQRIVIGDKTWAGPPRTGKTFDLYKSSFIQVQTASAKEIFIQLLGQEKAASLFSKARVQRKPILSRIMAWSSAVIR